MAWIESHQGLENHPKLMLLCSRTGWNLNEAIGILHRLWWWTLSYAENGGLEKYDPSQFLGRLDGKKNSDELLEILKECEFIDSDGKVHDWLDYAGRYLKGKYHTSNPDKLNEIEERYRTDLIQPKGNLKADNLPIPTKPRLHTVNNNTLNDRQPKGNLKDCLKDDNISSNKDDNELPY